ncbi:NADH-quinone oxidoreductase subunit NuoN [Nakamurella flava]|uniref:NADH-quinone oxidoreductase subunit N n=1 Tax=Nakamurella flava TaxID=2576308 RepID=A0A4U6QF49_9ACTN|nr:NADH-quinone oxidoreductase subunit NuoN [Nakamurella flava]TKV58609.1 NADH-quinone oxidoreductase subunit NuoN [Nakamurella flava]
MSQALLAAAAAVDPITAPSVDIGALLPVLVVLAGACLGIAVEAFAPRRARYAVQVGLSLAVLVAAGALVVRGAVADVYAVTIGSAIAVDTATYVMWGVLLVLAVPSLLLMADRVSEPGGAFAAQAAAQVGSTRSRVATRVAAPMQTEVFPLALFAVGGMMVFPAATDLVTLFVALEVLSLPLYLLCGLARRRRLISQESAVKYFLLGAFTSAIFLYGLAMLYGYAGSTQFAAIAAQARAGGGSDGLLLAGTCLTLVGLLFKASVGPFHLWTPDVYQGAPTPVTAFMAACTKVAAFAALLRVLTVALEPMVWTWQPVVAVIAAASMVIGAVLGITQTDMKRMLAYSSVAHAGFIIMGVMTVSAAGASGTMFYLLTYGMATIGAFAVLTLVRRGEGEASQLSDWAGLARRAPVLAAAMSLFLLSFAGIPLTAGFIGKLSVFTAAAQAGLGWLVVLAMVATAITAFFYLRIVVVMYFSDPVTALRPENAPAMVGGAGASIEAEPVDDSSPYVVAAGPLTVLVIAVAVAMTLILGVYPGPVLDLLSVPLPLLS